MEGPPNFGRGVAVSTYWHGLRTIAFSVFPWPQYLVLRLFYTGEPFFSQNAKYYASDTQDLNETDATVMRTNQAGQWSGDNLFNPYNPGSPGTAFTDYDWTITTGTYNFQANPLSVSTEQFVANSLNVDYTKNSNYPDTTLTTGYAYWQGDKYFQQKAVIDWMGTSDQRISYTDYYSNPNAPSGTGGNFGCVYKTYNSAFSSFTNTPATDSAWRDHILPADTNYASTINYDSQGRATDTWILHSNSPSNSYVQTHVTYNDSSGWYGEPQTVVEDYGSGKINRTTTTNAYDSAGRATDTTDAASHGSSLPTMRTAVS